MNRAIIAIGSNIEPHRHVEAAIAALAGSLRLLGRAATRVTKPIGFADQPDFVNTAVLIETALDAPALKDFLRSVEDRLGRVRTANKSAPRTIDLDIIVFNGLVTDADVHTRDFLRQAVLELWPQCLSR